MKGIIYLAKLPRRTQSNKQAYWDVIKDFSEKHNAKRINISKASCNLLEFQNKKLKASGLSPGKTGLIEYKENKENEENNDETETETCETHKVKHLTALYKYSKIRQGYWNSVTNQPTEKWFQRRREGFQNGKTKERIPRHIGYSKPISIWYQNKGYGFLEGRQRVYIENYKILMGKTKVFQALQNLVNQGQSVILLDFSCSEKHHLQKFTKEMYKKVIYDDTITLGHGYILASMT